MQQEQMSLVDTPQGTSPDPVDVFMERLMHRLLPLLTQQATATRTKLVGMSWVLAMLSLIVLGCLTYLFLSQGAARYQRWRYTTWSRLESIPAASRHRYDKSCRSPGQYRV